MCTNVIAVGQLGVWRLINKDLTNTDERALEEMMEREEPLQPELHNFSIVEISKGAYLTS